MIPLLALLLLTADPAVEHLDTRIQLPATIVFDCDFPARLKAPVWHAVDYWNRVSHARLFTVDSVCHDADTLFLSEASVSLIVMVLRDKDKPDDKGVNRLADTNHSTWSSVVKLEQINFYPEWLDYDIDYQEATVRHELGHAMGMDHSTSESCLLWPYIRMSRYSACSAEIDEAVRLARAAHLPPLP